METGIVLLVGTQAVAMVNNSPRKTKKKRILRKRRPRYHEPQALVAWTKEASLEANEERGGETESVVKI